MAFIKSVLTTFVMPMEYVMPKGYVRSVKYMSEHLMKTLSSFGVDRFSIC